MTTDPLARMWAAEAGEEPYIRPSWHVTMATQQNCEALGMNFDPHENKVLFVFGMVGLDGELSLARYRPYDWPAAKKWQNLLVVCEEELSLPETHEKLSGFWIGPNRIQEARDLIAAEGYAVSKQKTPSRVVEFPVVEQRDGVSMQMAASQQGPMVQPN